MSLWWLGELDRASTGEKVCFEVRVAAFIEHGRAAQKGQRPGSDDEFRRLEVRRCSDVIPVYVAKKDVLDVVRCQAAFSQGRHNVGAGEQRLACLRMCVDCRAV